MKRPKKVIIKHREVKSYISEYQCPHCHMGFVGAGIGENITRFTCTNCKNECIVEEHVIIKNKE